MKTIFKITTLALILFTTLGILSFSRIGHASFLGHEPRVSEKRDVLTKILNLTGDEGDYIALISSFTINPLNRDSSYTFRAFGKITENDIPINAGPIQIGDEIIYADTNNLYNYNYSLSEGKALFGTSVNVNVLDSSNKSQFSRRLTRKVIIVPKEIFPISITLPNNSVDRTQDYQLNWQPDPNNQFNKVQIQVSYYKGISQFNAVGMPKSIEDLVYNVADNGSFSIPQTDLSRYPKGAYVGISISRAWLDNTSGNIAYVSIVEAQSEPLLVVEPTSLNITIEGPDRLCSSSDYKMNNLPLGCSIIWSTTPSGIVSITSNGDSATLTKLSNGNMTLKGTLSGGCSNIAFTKQISVGTPIISGTYTDHNGQHYLQYWTGEPFDYNITCNLYDVQTNMSVSNANMVNWTRLSANPSSLSWSQNANDISFYFWQPGQTSVFKVVATNSCGTTTNSFGFKSINCNGDGGGGGGGCLQFAISPNPSQGTLNVVVPNIPAPCDLNLPTTGEQKSMQPKRAITQINVYDNTGSLKKSITLNHTNQATLNLSGLVSGVYYVEIKDGTYIERHRVVLQE